MRVFFLRGSAVMEDGRLHLFGEYELDTARAQLLREGRRVPLRPQAYKALKYLAENRGRMIGKDEFIQEVWGQPAVSDNSLVQCLKAVRRALGDESERYVRTERGLGYIFDPEGGGLETRGAVQDSIEQVELLRFVEEVEETGEEATAATPAQLRTAAAALPGRVRAAARWKAPALAAACLLVLGLAAAFYFSWPRPGPPANAASVRSLAVLPFKPLVPEGREEALEVGMADTLIAKLGNVGGVAVRPLSAVRRFGGLEQDPLDAGRQLGVEAVLDGTIQRSGDKVGVRARLLSVGDGRQLWEGHFDGPFTDIFAVQDAISEKVAGSLRPRLTSAEEGRLAKHHTENVKAYELYLRGRYHALKRTLPETKKAIKYFEQAIALDPAYALAYAGLADAHISSLAADLPPAEFLPKAKEAAQKAVELDDALAEAHAELGFVIFWWDWDWGTSEKELRRALELDPNSANARLYYAHLLSNTGRHEEALAEAKRARELDPLNLRINALEGQFLIHAGHTDEALTRLRETLEMDPNYFLARQYAASAYIEKGMYAEAVDEARRAREISGARSNLSEAFLGYALAKAGRRAEARAELEGLLKLSEERHVPPFHIAMVYNGLGEREETLEWLERGYREREPRMVFLKVEPRWNNLRSDPRFQDLVRRVGLPP